MGVPIAIFVVCFAAAVYASSRWLPDLAPDRLGAIAFFWQTGVLIALALGVYFLAPPREDDAGSLASGPEQGSRSA